MTKPAEHQLNNPSSLHQGENAPATQRRHMKILVASTPATGHLNPLLAIGRVLMAEGQEVAGLTGTALRDRIEGAGLKFCPLPAGADFDLRDLDSIAPDLKDIPPGPERSRMGLERFFVDTIPAQYRGLQQALQDFPADVIVADDMYFGLLPMLLGPRADRPAVVLCGTSFLHWPREDGASHFGGKPPATTQAERDEYATTAREHDRLLHQPLLRRLNEHLKDLGVGPVLKPLFETVLELADSFIQLTVPKFEYPRKDLSPSVHFVGTPPIIPNQTTLPSWAHELDGSRKVVLVTQGTVANHDFHLLIGPTLAALANEPELLVIATAGGRPIEAIPGPIPANARLASYLPFEWALAKADAFVTNGGYGSVNQALSFGLPLITAGLTQDKAEVNARVAWSGVGINLATNEPTPQALRDAVRTVLDKPDYRLRAASMAAEYAAIDTRAKIIRIVSEAAQAQDRQMSRDAGLQRTEPMAAREDQFRISRGQARA
jgi:MGT family glycosyltransferase